MKTGRFFRTALTSGISSSASLMIFDQLRSAVRAMVCESSPSIITPFGVALTSSTTCPTLKAPAACSAVNSVSNACSRAAKTSARPSESRPRSISNSFRMPDRHPSRYAISRTPVRANCSPEATEVHPKLQSLLRVTRGDSASTSFFRANRLIFGRRSRHGLNVNVFADALIFGKRSPRLSPRTDRFFRVR